MLDASALRKHTPSASLAKCGGGKTVIGLDIIQREFGSRWAKMRKSIYARLEVLLRQRLGSTDFFVLIDDVTCLVIMPTATPKEAQMCCMRIACDLHTGLLGPCAIEQLQIANVVATAEDVLEIAPIAYQHLAKFAENAGLYDLIASKTLDKFAAASTSRAPRLVAEPENRFQKRPYITSYRFGTRITRQ